MSKAPPGSSGRLAEWEYEGGKILIFGLFGLLGILGPREAIRLKFKKMFFFAFRWKDYALYGV